jgi:hypothetical protein
VVFKTTAIDHSATPPHDAALAAQAMATSGDLTIDG